LYVLQLSPELCGSDVDATTRTALGRARLRRRAYLGRSGQSGQSSDGRSQLYRRFAELGIGPLQVEAGAPLGFASGAQFSSAFEPSADRNRYALARRCLDAMKISSHLFERTVATNGAVYEAVAERVEPGMVIADLGCFSGALSALLAQDHPDCRLYGFDRSPELMADCESYFGLENLKFRSWDYSLPARVPEIKADILTCVLGAEELALPVGEPILPPGLLLKAPTLRRSHCLFGQKHESELHRRTFSRALPYFRAWREIAGSGSTLVAVLRGPHQVHRLAFLNAARRVGWSPILTESRILGDVAESLPMFVFRATRPSASSLSFAELVAWEAAAFPEARLSRMAHDYLTLDDRITLIRQKIERMDGREVRYEELGRSADGAYVFKSDSRERWSFEMYSGIDEATAQLAAASDDELVTSLPNTDPTLEGDGLLRE